MTVIISRRTAVALLWLGVGLLESGSAGTAPGTAPTALTHGSTGILTGQLASGSAYDRLWSVPLLYKNDDNPYLQELAIQGQLQMQYAYGSSNHGTYESGDMSKNSTWDDIDVRRFRLGVRARMLRTLKFHSLFELEPDFSPHIYQRTAEAHLTYAPCDGFNLSVGKTELKFTREQEISSREILPFERSQLVNQFYGGELTGLWIAGKWLAGGWLYELGAYGNDRQDEWTDMGGGAMILAKLGYNYTAGSGWDYAQAELHFLHNTTPGYRDAPGDLASPSYSNCIALSNDLTKGRFSLATEGFWGDGARKTANVGGLTVMPAWFLAEKLQLVTTFQVAASHEANGISLPTRYEQQVHPGGPNIQGDTYFAGYAGLNYYLYGHKLKIMSGAKFSHLSGGAETFNGWTWLAGCRLAF